MKQIFLCCLLIPYLLFNLSFGLSSSDSKNFAPQIMGFSGEANGQRPFASTKSTGDASKLSEGVGEKPNTQVFSNETVIESDEAYYDGHMIVLIGAVAVENTMGRVTAGKAYIDCIETSHSLEPTKVTLVDHVQLMNKETGQYALADLVTYYPDKQLMVLEGKESRVLFFDQIHNMQISAHSVHAERHPETHKPLIQGLGDVRFTFGQEELAKFKERFQW